MRILRRNALGVDVLEPWAEGEDPDSDDVRLVRWTRRDFEKSVRVPPELAAEMSKAKALGQQAWQEAHERCDQGGRPSDWRCRRCSETYSPEQYHEAIAHELYLERQRREASG